VGSKKFIEVARKSRQMLGGTTRQGGVIAAAGLVALRTMIDRLAEDHAHARVLAEKLSTIPGLEVQVKKVQTNIVRTKTSGLGVPAAAVSEKLVQHNVYVLAQQADTLRWLTHRHVTAADVDEAAATMAKVAETLRK
jgi:threonine aldolase